MFLKGNSLLAGKSTTEVSSLYHWGIFKANFYFKDHQSQEKQLWTLGNGKKSLYVSVMTISRETTVH